MAKLLFRLRGVPEDEARDVRELLEAHQIDYYETSAGNWGISMPGLWLRDEEQLSEAQALLDAYQQERALRARETLEAERQEGRQATQWQMLREQPLRTCAYLGLAVAVLYISISVFVSF